MINKEENNNDKSEDKFSKKTYFKRVDGNGNEDGDKEKRKMTKLNSTTSITSANPGENLLDIIKDVIEDLEDDDSDESSSIIIRTSSVEGDSDHECPIFELYHQKILGVTWDEDKLEKFLKARGYTISEITVDGETYKHGTKEGVDTKDYDLYEIFEEEVQDIILNWLLKNG